MASARRRLERAAEEGLWGEALRWAWVCRGELDWESKRRIARLALAGAGERELCYLLALGFPLEAPMGGPQGCAGMAASEGMQSLLRALGRKRRASVLSPGKDGATPLWNACANGRFGCMEMLARMGADPWSRSGGCSCIEMVALDDELPQAQLSAAQALISRAAGLAKAGGWKGQTRQDYACAIAYCSGLEGSLAQNAAWSLAVLMAGHLAGTGLEGLPEFLESEGAQDEPRKALAFVCGLEGSGNAVWEALMRKCESRGWAQMANVFSDRMLKGELCALLGPEGLQEAGPKAL